MAQQFSGFFLDENHLEITFNQEFKQSDEVISGLDDLSSNEYKILASVDELLNQLKFQGFIENKVGPALNTKPSNVNFYEKKVNHFPSVYHTSDNKFADKPKVKPIEYLEVAIHSGHCVITFGSKANSKYQHALGRLLEEQLHLSAYKMPIQSADLDGTSKIASPKSGF